MLWILQFYICLAVLYEIICLQYFISILLSILLFYLWRLSLSQSFVTFYYSKI